MRLFDFESMLVGMAVALMLVLLAEGCTSAPDMTQKLCPLVKMGLERIEKELQSDKPPSDDPDTYTLYVEKPLRTAGMEDILDQAKEVWDKIPTEDKLKAAKALLELIDSEYCKGTSAPGDIEKKARGVRVKALLRLASFADWGMAGGRRG